MTSSGSKKRVGVQMSVVDDPRLFVRTVRTPTGLKQGKLLLNPEKNLDLRLRKMDAPGKQDRWDWRLYRKVRGNNRPPFFERLLERQHYVCPICRSGFSKERTPHAHHPAGEVLSFDNCVLLHRECHRALHVTGRLWREITRTWGRGRRQSQRAEKASGAIARVLLAYAKRERGRPGYNRARREGMELVALWRGGNADRGRAYRRRRATGTGG